MTFNLGDLLDTKENSCHMRGHSSVLSVANVLILVILPSLSWDSSSLEMFLNTVEYKKCERNDFYVLKFPSFLQILET